MASAQPPSNSGVKWTRDEHVIAFNLYCQLPFGKLHHGNPRIIELARVLERTPDSVAMKLSNFARLDPTLRERGVGGLSRGAKGEEEVWIEFAADPESLVFESERLVASRRGQLVEMSAGIDTRDLPPPGKERDALVRVRVNQGFFRRRIISAFDTRCCVTGLEIPELLVASHIVPWARDPENRMNPRNGLCLNALHDKAFDKGLMWIEEGFVVRFSERFFQDRRVDNPATSWLTGFDGKRLRLPKMFTPDPELLRRHRNMVSSR